MALGVSHARRAVIGLVTEIDTALAIAALRVWRFFMPPTVRVYASKVQQERAGIKTPAMRRHFADFMRGGSDETDGGYTIGGRFYRGGVWNGPLSAAEVAALQAAGYAARIVAVTNPDDPKALPAALDV
jgi:hypothetical protein